MRKIIKDSRREMITRTALRQSKLIRQETAQGYVNIQYDNPNP